ncbi:MAG: Membrane protein involved in the export of O-antigen and teichoic acid [Candidatus Moranbacteria bacterium GW2011_GWE1_35_17]|nr:MAG: Membrane protein involved in the export of O-antigen and teichoic acid [Candidatus Moranbacteria bacterium GW2011_GWE1_35_17]KKP71848.1 MAG: Membrane protein involved in the export of O-antigen and teichoic acid [Candidatus Moranbacteria bacterium GW2011_GWE2_35_164]KKP83112.1 MAG: Membrane protein involved in the export of O-antigen and teichoic acid [Candidatus Moranbacteria bacterium GW2011_GWF2_35_54]KKP83544.1 MAG: Membrane protein involved in the export of O-antigen and teichoic ac
MALARKIAYNVVASTIAKVCATVLALVNIGFITRYLGVGGFGDYATVLAFLSFFGAILDLGLYSIATREISRNNADEKKIMSNVFSLRLLSSLALFIIAPLLFIFLPYSEDIKKGILIIALSYTFSSSYMVFNGVFQKNLRMDKVTITELLGKIIQVFFIILAVKNNWGFTAIIFSVLWSSMLTFGIVVFLSRKYIKFSLKFDFDYWKSFLKMSMPVGISALVTFLYFKMDTIMLSVLKGSEAVGIYNMAYKIIENITFFPGMIVGLILPLLSMYVFSDKVNFTKIINKTAKVFIIIIVPLIVGTLFLAEDIINIIGGKEFLISANALRVLIVALAFIFFGNLFNSILLSANLQNKLMHVLSFCAVFNIGLNFALIPKYSYMGAATVSLMTEFLVVALTAYIVSKYVDYRLSMKGWGKVIFSGLWMALFLAVLNNLNFIYAGLGSIFVYGLFLWLTRAITIREVKSLLVSPR